MMIQKQPLSMEFYAQLFAKTAHQEKSNSKINMNVKQEYNEAGFDGDNSTTCTREDLKSPTSSHSTDALEESYHSPRKSSQSPVKLMVEEPALFVLTKEFPDWDLQKIVEFVDSGKTKADLQVRNLRTKEEMQAKKKEKTQKKKVEENEEWLSEEEVALAIEQFTEEAMKIIKLDDLNQDKVYKILEKNGFEVRKALCLVKKNVTFYIKYFKISKWMVFGSTKNEPSGAPLPCPPKERLISTPQSNTQQKGSAN